MKAIALFQHSLYAEPGYVVDYLDELGIPWVLYRTDLGQAVPKEASDYAGLCFLGGGMSVNDPLPWIAEELALISEADRLDIPMIGHCFGSQLIAKAFGAKITRNPVKEIGWGWMTVHANRAAHEWLGVSETRIRSFQWHGDTFEVPKNAELFLSSEFCANQAYVIRDLHLGMQCHLEMTPELVRKSAKKGTSEVEKEIAINGSAAAQTAEKMFEELTAKTDDINATMRRLYDRWTKGLKQ